MNVIKSWLMIPVDFVAACLILAAVWTMFVALWFAAKFAPGLSDRVFGYSPRTDRRRA